MARVDDADHLLREHGLRLADAVVAALPRWVARCIGDAADAGTVAEAGRRAAEDIGPRLRALLAEDVDAQRENPLAVVREAVRYPTEVLRSAGVPVPPRRDPFGERHFPGDDYELVPMSWRDVDDSLHEPGLVWGALKARASRDRHGRA